jgi:hypothetical protein
MNSPRTTRSSRLLVTSKLRFLDDGIGGCNHTAIFRYLARAPALFLDPSKPTLELENTHFIPHLIALG